MQLQLVLGIALFKCGVKFQVWPGDRCIGQVRWVTVAKKDNVHTLNITLIYGIHSKPIYCYGLGDELHMTD